MNRALRWLPRWALALFAAQALQAQSPTLPVYLEESHAGSFHFLAQQLPLETAHTLVLFDAHSDASSIAGSDEVRTLLRRVASAEERREQLERWRQQGVVQCFDWIEPLLPAPLAKVVWVPGERLSRAEAWHREKIAREYLDTHEEAFPRATGPVGGRYQAQGFEALRRSWKDDGQPLVVSIDLDYFAPLAPAAQAAAFEAVWDWTTRRPGLVAVTLCVSRLWLRDDAEAHRLVECALRGALSLPAVELRFEPFATAGPDRSERAKKLRAEGRELPQWRIEDAPESLRALLLAQQARIRLEREPARWRALLAEWERQAPAPKVELRERSAGLDGAWRVRVGESAVLALEEETEATTQVEWLALQPWHPRCNLFARDDSWTGFAAGAPPRPRWREVRLGEGANLDLAAAPVGFAAESGCGSVRFFARIRLAGGQVRESPPLEVRRSRGDGFRGALTEQYALPYLLGGSILSDGAVSGPDTGWGADCANFVVCALRRSGRLLPWCDPKQLRPHLRLLRRAARAGAETFTADQLAAGLIVHLGTHVAAVLEDRPPLGVLDAGDLVAHQLEGPPETLALGELLRRRKAATFDLYSADAPEGARVLLGGDVMLGRSVGERMERGLDPLAGLAPLFRGAAAVAVNVECVPAAGGAPAPGRKFHLRAPVRAAEVLRQAGVRLAGLANNHADDFGEDGLGEALGHLRGAGLQVLGAGTAADAYEPVIVELPGGTKAAFLALTDVAVPSAGLRTLQLAQATDRPSVAKAIERARRSADVVIALLHWGEEGSATPGAAQHELARWLIERGVGAIAGAHPHRLQPLETWRGVPVAFSLGNLVFDGAPAVPWWNAGALLELVLAPGGKVAQARLVPVQLADDGLPRLPAKTADPR